MKRSPLTPTLSQRETGYLVLVLLTALPWGLARAGAPSEPLLERAESEARAAVNLARVPRGAAHLFRLQALRDEVPDLHLLAQTYSQILAKPGTDPNIRILARQFAASVERARGRLTKAAELMQPLNYIHGYYVLGAFDNEGKSGCGTDYGPEHALDLQATYAAKGHSAGWRKLYFDSYDGYVDLSSVVRPNREAVAYALTFLDASQETRVNLALGVSGAFRLWVNGQMAASEDRYNQPRPDQNRVVVRLRKGTNRVLLKVCQAGGAFGFYLRQERTSGAAAAISVLPDALPPLPKGPPPAPHALPTLVTTLEQELKKRPNDSLLRGDFATVLFHVRAFDESEHRDAADAARAAETAPSDPSLQVLAAMLEDEDSNERRKHLEVALRLAPTSALAQLMMAQHDLGHGHPERALTLAQESLRLHPSFPAMRLVMSRACEALGEWPRGAEMLEATFRDFPHLPQVVRDAALLSRRLDRPQEAADRLRVALALRYDDLNARRGLAGLLVDLSQVGEAEREMERILKLDPFDNSIRLRLAELYAANGNAEDARRLFAEARTLAPDEPEVYEREGRALLEMGRRDQALGAFERSLQLRPQNPALKEAVRSLKGEKGAYGLEYALNVAALAKEADSYAGEDAVYLADYAYVRVQPSGLSSRFHQMAVKVFSQRGVDAFRSFPVTYSPARQEIQVLRARVTKPDGSVIESHSESERNLNEPWAGMYYDARARFLSFPALAAGDVLELQYRVEDTALDNLLSDYWGDVEYIQATAPKIRYEYIVDMPAERPLYWNKSQLPSGIVSKQERKDGRTLYRWSASRLPKVIPEPAMPGWAEVVPTLHVSTYKSWEQVGRYYWGLIRDQLSPSEDLRKTVEQILSRVNRKDEQAVIRAIYDFVVSRTRYVALEFGIHGYRPYRVDRVLARRFGDCKDKASLIYAMLKVAGVDSRIVLLRMRHLGSLGQEPASLAAFNHAIVYVPKYDLFMDGTAEFHGARELPGDDRLANVLIVEPSGSSSFRITPEGSPDDNVTSFSLDVALRPDGSAEVKGLSKVHGTAAPNYRRAYQSAATRKATLEQAWAQAFPGLSVEQIDLSDISDLDQDVTLSYRMRVPRYGEVAPSMLRFHPFGGSESYTQSYASLVERRFDLVLPQPSLTRFSVQYALPAGYAAVALPPDLREETKFGHFQVSCRGGKDSIACNAEIGFTAARVKPEDYLAFRAFLGRLDQAFTRKLSIVGGEGRTAGK